jgi:hypothetical protein
VIGYGDALAAFDQRPDFTTTIDDGLQTLEQRNLPRKKLLGPRSDKSRSIAAFVTDDEYPGRALPQNMGAG